MVVPRNGWFIMETLLKWMIWGYPHFRKHTYQFECSSFHPYLHRFMNAKQHHIITSPHPFVFWWPERCFFQTSKAYENGGFDEGSWPHWQPNEGKSSLVLLFGVCHGFFCPKTAHLGPVVIYRTKFNISNSQAICLKGMWATFKTLCDISL